jgi:hypothetical protein
MSKPISPLRQRMIDHMKFATCSRRRKELTFARANLSVFFGRSPDQLTFEDVRAYQLHLVSRGLQAATIIQIMCAIRFFYGTTLDRPDAAEQIPLARKHDTLPAILSQEEIVRLLKAVPDLRYRTLFMTIYAPGLRVSEARSTSAALKVKFGSVAGLRIIASAGTFVLRPPRERSKPGRSGGWLISRYFRSEGAKAAPLCQCKDSARGATPR